MSTWTYLKGIIDADTFARSTSEALYKAQTVINHLARITGSEGDAEFYINIKRGFSILSPTDELGNFSNLYNNEQWCYFEFQTCVLISIEASLRNRRFEQTLFETTRMLARLGTRLCICNCLLSVKGVDSQGKHKCFVFHDPGWLLKE